MTTAVAEKSLVMPWDHFLNQLPGKENLRQHIEVFRRTEWHNILRDLARHPHGGLGQAPTYWELPEGLEPHWVLPGKAIYWQEQSLRDRKIVNIDGRSSVEVTWHNLGWVPAGPFPANNAGQIAHYLSKGLRLRPPENGVSVEARHEAAIPSEGYEAEEEAPKPEFFCNRHGMRPKGFITWKGYVRHCMFYKEQVERTPPSDVLERARKFKYFCMMHDRGFNHRRHATQHMRAELRKNGKSLHPSIDQMEVKEEIKQDG